MEVDGAVDASARRRQTAARKVNASKTKLPPGIVNAYWFQAFNAISWQICVGSPLILFARDLGASATALGILAGLAPALTIMQIPASRYAADYGYKRLMLTGWSARVGILGLLGMLPLAVRFLPRDSVITLLLAIMFFFCLLRGLATCAWMPWLTSIVPEHVRGSYLSRDRTFINFASVIALVASGSLMAGQASMTGFALVFFLGFASGAVSLTFLKRIPEPLSTGTRAAPAETVDWRQMFRDGPFLRLLAFGAVVQLALSAHATFVLVFLREEIGFGDGTILWIGAGANLFGMLGLHMLGRHADRIGSRPYLGLVLAWWAVAIPAWFLIATGAFASAGKVAIGLMITGGYVSSCYELALTRLLMNTVAGRPGQARYFALYAVVVSIIIAMVPVAWGIGLDALRNFHAQAFGFQWNRYAVLFAAESVSLFAILLFLLRVRESRGESPAYLVQQIFVGMPSRGVSYLMQMFR